MEFSYKWLREYVKDIPEVEKTAVEVGLKSFELEGIEKKNDDYLIDWDVLPNRSSDCLCYLGIAKEIAGVFDLDFQSNLSDFKGDENLKTSDFLSLKVENNELVPRATKRLAVDVKITESPEWLKKHLENIGQKSINNVVDITNYVMWVTGQPVHAFDYDKLAGKKDFKNISIQFAQNGEKILDLSGDEHTLDNKTLVIHDGEKSLDIAGIKGGQVSGVDENTNRLMLSAVNFNFKQIRLTSKRIKLQTDASKRYENEVPLNKIDWAMVLMSQLLEEYAGAKISSEIIDTLPKLPERNKIKVKLDKINSVLGLDLKQDRVEDIFRRLDIKSEFENGVFEVLPPFERLDLKIPEDIIEEVGRIYGYENIQNIEISEGFNLPQVNLVKSFRNNVVDLLVSLGFYEVNNRSIVADGPVKLKNSLNAKATSLRDNLIEQIKNKVEKNFVYSSEPKFFEIGKIFTSLNPENDNMIIGEHWSFAGIIGKKKIKEKQKEDLFYRTKGVLEKVFEVLKIKNIDWKDGQGDILSELWADDEKIGDVGVNFWEINFEKLIKNIDESINYKPVSKYPKIERDVAFWVPLDYKVADAEKIILSVLAENLEQVTLFDIYKDVENKKVNSEQCAGREATLGCRKSFAFKIVFQSYTETLSDEFANEEMEKVYNILKENKFETR